MITNITGSTFISVVPFSRPSLYMMFTLASTGSTGMASRTHAAPCATAHCANHGTPSRSCLQYNRTNESATQGLSSKKKAVCFAPTAMMKIIPDTTSLPSNKIWYSQEENMQFLVESLEIVKLRRHFMHMSEDDFEETCNENTRGLEQYLSKRLHNQFKQEQDTVIAAVLLFQEEMKVRGLPIDQNALSRVSQLLSASASDRAYQLGLLHRSTCNGKPGK